MDQGDVPKPQPVTTTEIMRDIQAQKQFAPFAVAVDHPSSPMIAKLNGFLADDTQGEMLGREFRSKDGKYLLHINNRDGLIRIRDTRRGSDISAGNFENTTEVTINPQDGQGVIGYHFSHQTPHQIQAQIDLLRADPNRGAEIALDTVSKALTYLKHEASLKR